ncbi:MAG TPA: archease [Candidatus Bathyarchaeia archaeon]|nr:archease [Candidatus Bathyarchaeia archaeon]
MLGESGGYRLLEHVTDALIEAWGTTLEEAFSQAGLALFDTMLHVKRVQPKTKVEIQTNGHDEKELLYNYLEELLLLFEVKRLALRSFVVSSITPTQAEIRLRGNASGEPYDRAKHNGKVEVKGITYHLMEIEKQAGKVTVRFLLDL